MPVIVGLDASGKTAGVCIMANGCILYEETLNQGLTHSETLLPLVEKAFAKTTLTPGDIGLYAVTGGPGSFTGLRIGMSLVKGLALPCQTPAVAVSTLHALALGSGLQGHIIPALDARRGEVYWAAFACTAPPIPAKIQPLSGKNAVPDKALASSSAIICPGYSPCARLTPDTAGPAAGAAAYAAFLDEPVFFVGDGAELCYNICGNGPGTYLASAQAATHIARGAALAACMLDALPARDSAAALRPQYLRLSQAERERRKALDPAAQATAT